MGTIRTEIDKIQPAAWSRATVADGNWLQANTLTKLKERDDKIADLVDTELTSVKTSVATNASNIRQNSTAIESNKTEITNLKTKVTTAEGDIDALEDCTESLAKADEQIWDKIDLMDAASDVVDIYGNRAAFDAAKAEIETWITDRDIVKVLSGENDQQEYWRFLSAGGSAGGEENTWDLIGTMAPYYSTHEIDEKFDNLSVGGVKDILYTYNPDPSEHFPEASEKTLNDIYLNLYTDDNKYTANLARWYTDLEPGTEDKYQWVSYSDIGFYTKAGVDANFYNKTEVSGFLTKKITDKLSYQQYGAKHHEYTAENKILSINKFIEYSSDVDLLHNTKIGYYNNTKDELFDAEGYIWPVSAACRNDILIPVLNCVSKNQGQSNLNYETPGYKKLSDITDAMDKKWYSQLYDSGLLAGLHRTHLLMQNTYYNNNSDVPYKFEDGTESSYIYVNTFYAWEVPTKTNKTIKRIHGYFDITLTDEANLDELNIVVLLTTKDKLAGRNNTGAHSDLWIVKPNNTTEPTPTDWDNKYKYFSRAKYHNYNWFSPEIKSITTYSGDAFYDIFHDIDDVDKNRVLYNVNQTIKKNDTVTVHFCFANSNVTYNYNDYRFIAIKGDNAQDCNPIPTSYDKENLYINSAIKITNVSIEADYEETEEQ